MKFRTISLETEISLMIERYSVGIDFGTLSARAILVDTHSGREVFTSIRTPSSTEACRRARRNCLRITRFRILPITSAPSKRF